MTGAVLDFAATVQGAFYRHQADEQRLELLQTIAQALAASFEVAQRLHTAGNITDLDLARERALFEEAKLQLRAAEIAVRQSREHLNTLMGLWGQQTAWQIDRRLPDLPAQPLPFADLERPALQPEPRLWPAPGSASSWLANRWASRRATPCIPESSLGAEAERDEGVWKVGPTVDFPIPLFDQGQARVGRAVTELRRAQQEYYALGVQIRARRSVRCTSALQGAQDRALLLSRHPAALAGTHRQRDPAAIQRHAARASLISCAPGSSRFRPPSPISTRCSTTGWPAPTSSSS